MSSRALRKAQRARAEQEQQKRLEQADGEESEEDQTTARTTQTSAFALLDAMEDDGDEDEGVPIDEEDAKGQPQQRPPEGILQAKSTIKKRKKKKSKAKPIDEIQGISKPPRDEGLDEIDKALKQLSTNGDASLSGATSAGVNSSIDETSKLLAIDTNHLHSQNEMRRLFGRAALEHTEDEQPPQPGNVGGNRRQQRRVQQVGLAEALRRHDAQGGRSSGLAAAALRRNIFVQGKEDWPLATSGGLGMEIEEKRADGTTLYRFAHNRVYQDVQAEFQIAVESMDPQRLIVLLQHNPFHISTLLQVSEIAKQERDHTTSGDLLTRALFSFGRAVHSTFPKALAEGKARLDFRRPENREFWLAAWRYMQNLSMRALWRTVYEWAKLLLSLAPEDDPYAMWLVLDQYALRARQDLDYLNLSRNSTFSEHLKDMPNINLAQGFAEYRGGNKSKGQQTLFTAVRRFPWVVARLMQELNLDPPPAVWGKEPRSESERLHSELYAAGAKDIWNTPENTALLLEIASAIPADAPSADVSEAEVEENAARHVLLSETPSLIALIPKRYTATAGSASDPLPPGDSYPSYLSSDLSRSSAYRAQAGQRTNHDMANDLRELHTLYDQFSRLLPDFNRDGDVNEYDLGALDEDETRRRIEDSGVDVETITQLIHRMRELQTRLGAELEADEFASDSGEELEIPGGYPFRDDGEIDDRRPRTEDAEDAGD